MPELQARSGKRAFFGGFFDVLLSSFYGSILIRRIVPILEVSLMPKFLLRLENDVIKEITAEDQITVGRKPDNQVVIDSPAVSGHHCKLVRIGETYFVEDRYSTNGVFL